MFNVGVIGCGYWGPNLIRNYSQLNRSRVLRVADLDEGRLAHMKKLYPAIETTTNYQDIVHDAGIDIVTVATPVSTHFRFAKEALMAGKHVFVEKPIAASAKEAEALVAIAREQNLKLMVGHTFIYTAAVRKMKEIIQSGELGEIFSISSQRLNLGLFQNDINVLWDLAPHDVSIILFLLEQEPVLISASGSSHINRMVHDVGQLIMKFNDNLIAYAQVSWLHPDKVRKMTVVGSKKMMTYDDVESSDKIRIYDKAVESPKHYDSYAEFPYSYKYGDIVIPRLDGKEPLSTELSHFLDCIEHDLIPMSSGEKGIEVVRILETSDISLKSNSAFVSLIPPSLN